MATITDVQTGLYGIPNEESLDDATQSFDELELVTVELTTSDGVTGVGFTYTIGEGGASVESFLAETLAPELDRADVAPRRLRSDLRGATTFVGREGVSELALAAVDIAAWDALGKGLGAPLYELLGGTREAVPGYETNGGWIQYDRETLVENAREAADAGFHGMKMKVGRGHAEDARRIAAVREALPESMDLMVDANCSFSVAEARRFCEHLDVPIAWLEEPLPKHDHAAHADLRRLVEVPLASGENAYDATEFKQALAMDALDVLQPDVCRVGGITPWMAVADMASAWSVDVSPHYVEPIHVHLAAAADNVPYIEHHSTVLDTVLADPVLPENGAFRPPDRPGHGLAFDGLDAYAKL
ncbi:MAG: mandelate racemase/muconate lactonizing enzyme family protein [Halobacteriaceae archaeon]